MAVTQSRGKRSTKSASNGCEIVRKYILTEFQQGDKLPKVGELSKKLNTSRYAAERVLTEMSAEGIIERKPRFGSVLLDKDASSESSSGKKQSCCIAFMADELESYLSGEIMRGIEAQCREHGILLSLLNSNYDAKTEEQMLRTIVDNQSDGAIIRIGEHMENLKILEEVIPEDYPVVLVDRSDSNAKYPCIKTNQQKAAIEAVRHLVSLGHRKIAHITYDNKVRPLLKEMEKRRDGYLSALQEADIEIPGDYIQGAALFMPGERPTPTYYHSLGYEPMNKLLLSADPPTAVFLLHFHFASGVIRAINDHGLRVPEDISVISIDDETTAPHLNPPLTVVAQPLREMGAKAVEILMQMMNGEEPEDSIYKLDPRLIVRGSTSRVKS